MRYRFAIIIVVSLLAAGTVGCGRSDTVYIEKTESVASGSTEDTKDASDEPSLKVSNETSGVSGEASGVSNETSGGFEEAFNLNAEDAFAKDFGETAESAEDGQLCYVHVCGAVRVPGVYALAQGSRVYEALLMAGGLTEDASERSVNQAELLWDGEMIFVPTLEEARDGVTGVWAGATTGDTSAKEVMEISDERVNLNTASKTELMTLPGIGQAKAESIVAYRETNGAFSSVEEIMQVDGIKEGLYTRIKDKIRVK